MEKHNETCGICSLPYDADDRIPRVLVNCGHTLCSCCLKETLKSPQLRRCPYDNLEFKRPQKYLANFPVNFALLALLEEKNRNVCKTHGEKLLMFCLQDKVKICYGCALFGVHKGHTIKKINDLKAQGMKTKQYLEESFIKFEKNQLEKDNEKDLLKTEFLSKIGNKFEEIKNLLREKESEFNKQMESLFEQSEEMNARLLLKRELDRVSEGIDQAYHQEENLALLDQDFTSMISNLQPQDVKQDVLKFSNQGLEKMKCMELFFTNEIKSIKSFDFLNQVEIMKHKEELQLCSEEFIEIKRKPFMFFKTNKPLFTVEVCDTCLFVRTKDSNLVDLTIDLAAHNKINKISVELDKYLSLFQSSADFNFLSEVLNRFKNNTCLSVSFRPEGLTDYLAECLLNLLFFRTQHLTEIEMFFERCEITNQLISFFCTNILPKATFLKSLTLKLDSTRISDESLIELAKSLSPLRKNLESFTLGAGGTAITDDGIQMIFTAILEAKVIDLDLKETLVTDKSLKVLANHMMPCMKNLERFSLNSSQTKITMEGITSIFAGIPNGIKCLNLKFDKVHLLDEVVSLFEEKVGPKLRSGEEVHMRVESRDLKVKVAKLLGSSRKEAYELNKGDNCSKKNKK